jgi:hypothetical protein
MTEWTTMDMGWSKDIMNYGGGLMTMNADFANPLQIESTTFVGHGGETYGYKSTQGYNSALGYSLSIMVH